MKTISTTEANRSFSQIVNRAAKGEVFGVTLRGKVIVRIVPESDYNDHALAIRRRLHLEKLRQQEALNLPKMSRDEIYE